MGGRSKTIPCLLALATLTACAVARETVQVTAEAKGSESFSLGPPTAYRAGDGIRLSGRVCRLGRSTALSPPSIRLEHVARDGGIVETSQSSVATIYRSTDQACRTYAANLAWALADGDTVRACFDRARPCPVTSTAKAVIAAPARASPPS